MLVTSTVAFADISGLHDERMSNATTVVEFLDGCGRNSDITGNYSIFPHDHGIRFLEGVGFPFFFVFGSLGNTLNLIIIRRNKQKSTADVFVMAMAVADLFIMWLFFPIWLKKIHPNLLDLHTYVRFDRLYKGIHDWLIITCYFISDWITVTFSLERLLVISNPLRFLGRFTTSNALTAVSIILLIGFIKPTFFVLNFFSWLQSGLPEQIWLKERPEWMNDWGAVHNTVIVLDRVIAFTILLTINILITVYLCRREKILSRDLREGQLHSSRPSSNDSFHGSTILSRGCAIQCLIFKFPCFTYYALLLATRPPFCTYHFPNYEQEYWLAFVSFFLMFNYSINFYLYYAFSEKFRQQLRATFPDTIEKLEQFLKSYFSRTNSAPDVEGITITGQGKRVSQSSTTTAQFSVP